MDRVLGIIKAGDMVQLRGDAETLRALADSAMGREIAALEQENQRLKCRLTRIERKLGILRREKMLREAKQYRIRRPPEPVRRVRDYVLTRWALLVLGREAVYGEEERRW